MENGLYFLSAVFATLAGLLGLVGAVLAVLSRRKANGFSDWALRVWTLLCQMNPVQAFSLGAHDAVKTLRAISSSLLGRSHDDVAFAGIIGVVSLVFLPLASIGNVLQGGSPFLLQVYAMLLGALLVLIVIGELRWAQGLAGFLAVLIYMGFFVFGPLYAFQSFVGRAFSQSATQSLFFSLGIVVLLFSGVAGAVLCHEGLTFKKGKGRGMHRVVDLLVSATLIGFVLFFGCLFLGERALIWPDVPPEWPDLQKNWPMFLASVGGFVINLVLFFPLIERAAKRSFPMLLGSFAAGIIVGAGLAFLVIYLGDEQSETARDIWNRLTGIVEGRSGLRFGPEFWAAWLPVVPVLALMAAGLFTTVAWAVLRLRLRRTAMAEVAARPLSPLAEVFFMLALLSGVLSGLIKLSLP